MIGQIIDNGTGAIELDRKNAWQDKMSTIQGFIILCVIPNRQQFVTWYMDDKGLAYSGHYSIDLKCALADFEARS